MLIFTQLYGWMKLVCFGTIYTTYSNPEVDKCTEISLITYTVVNHALCGQS